MRGSSISLRLSVDTTNDKTVTIGMRESCGKGTRLRLPFASEEFPSRFHSRNNVSRRCCYTARAELGGTDREVLGKFYFFFIYIYKQVSYCLKTGRRGKLALRRKASPFKLYSFLSHYDKFKIIALVRALHFLFLFLSDKYPIVYPGSVHYLSSRRNFNSSLYQY